VRDDLIVRLERNALIACVVMAAAAGAIARDWRGPVAVFGGGILIGTSVVSLHGGLDGLAASGRAGRAAWKMAARYALLAFLAYVMIARLRLPPLGLLAGASSVVAATVVEALRFLLKKTKS
jgi:hypothetical protein